MVEIARCGYPIATQRSIVSLRRQDHCAAKDDTARHATQDAANLGANLFMYGVHDIIDEVELFFFQVLRDLVSTPDFFVYTMCVGRVYTCVYICLHIYTSSLPSLHVCVRACMFTCTHTDLQKQHQSNVCVYIRTCMHADGCVYIFTICVCACIFTFMCVCVYLHTCMSSLRVCVCMRTCTHADLHVYAYIFADTHAEFACVCVNVYIYVGRVYMSVHVY